MYKNPLLEIVPKILPFSEYVDLDEEQLEKELQPFKTAFLSMLKDEDQANNLLTNYSVMPSEIPSYFNRVPLIWLRSTISVSLNNLEGFEKIAKFSNNKIFEVGAGSGYNARVLELMGVDVYAIDIPNSQFKVHFTDIYVECDKTKIKQIAENNGAIMYIWANSTFHWLNQWIENGGRKFIICGCYQPDHFAILDGCENPPLMCPVFPPKKLQKKFNFKLVETFIPPHYSEEDPSTCDSIQFWEIE